MYVSIYDVQNHLPIEADSLNGILDFELTTYTPPPYAINHMGRLSPTRGRRFHNLSMWSDMVGSRNGFMELGWKHDLGENKKEMNIPGCHENKVPKIMLLRW